MNNFFRIKNGYVSALVLIILLFSAGTSSGAEKEHDKTGSQVRMAVIPFQAILAKEESGSSVTCPLSGMVFFGGKIAEGGQKVTEELFIEKMKDFKEVEIIPQDRVEAVYRRVQSESWKMPLLETLKKTGTELDADLVAVGYVFRYRERIGYDYSAEKPASVAFAVHLISFRDGSKIWRGVFDKTQKSLMEDVLQIASFYKGGGKWLTVRQLTKQGMDQVFDNFPGFTH